MNITGSSEPATGSIQMNAQTLESSSNLQTATQPQPKTRPYDLPMEIVRARILTNIVYGWSRTPAIDAAIAWAKKTWPEPIPGLNAQLDKLLLKKEMPLQQFLHFLFITTSDDIYLWGRACLLLIKDDVSNDAELVQWVRARMQTRGTDEYDLAIWFAEFFKPLEPPYQSWAENALLDVLALKDLGDKSRALTWLEAELRPILGEETDSWMQRGIEFHRSLEAEKLQRQQDFRLKRTNRQEATATA